MLGCTIYSAFGPGGYLLVCLYFILGSAVRCLCDRRGLCVTFVGFAMRCLCDCSGLWISRCLCDVKGITILHSTHGLAP